MFQIAPCFRKRVLHAATPYSPDGGHSILDRGRAAPTRGKLDRGPRTTHGICGDFSEPAARSCTHGFRLTAVVPLTCTKSVQYGARSMAAASQGSPWGALQMSIQQCKRRSKRNDQRREAT
jgi:hypothetical protein